MDIVLRIIRDITKNADMWSKEKDLIRYSNKYVAIKEIVAKAYHKTEYNFEKDFDMVISEYEEYGIKYIPFELLVLLAVEVNNNEKYSELISLNEIDKFNNFILECIKDKTVFSINPLYIRKKLQMLSISNSAENLRKFLVEKLKEARPVVVDNIESQDIVIKVEGLKNYEIVNYYSDFKNYYFLPNCEITFISKDTGDIISRLGVRKKLLNKNTAIDYILVYKNTLDIRKQVDRILLIKLYHEIYNSLYVISEEASREIFKNKGFIEDDFINKLEVKLSVKNISRYIERLEKNPIEEEVIAIIDELDDCEKIFEILKISNSILKRELDVNTYITAIVKCSTLNNKSISLSVLCEELLINKPIVIDAVAKFLFDLYDQKLYTKNTLETIKYLTTTISNNAVIDETFVRININNNILNRQVLEKFIRVKSFRNDGLDDITYKIIHNYNFEYNKDIISIFKKFYDKYKDKKSLEIIVISLIKNNIRLKRYNVTPFDIEILLKHYIKIGHDISEKILMPILEEFYEDKEVRSTAVSIIEENYSKNNFRYIDVINKNYSHLIEALFSESSEVFHRYLDYILSKSTEYYIGKDNVISLINRLLHDAEFDEEKRLSIFLKLTAYYSKVKDINSFTDIINYYMINLSSVDNYQSFKKILILEVKNLEFIAESLYTTKIIEVENAQPILNLLATHFLENNMFEAVETIFKYYVGKGNYGIDSLIVLNQYLDKAEHINIFIYSAYIKQFLVNTQEEKQKELYIKLCIREDFPVELREEFYYLDCSEKNLDFLINAFEEEEISSVNIKLKALEKYYNNNLKFAEILSLGEYDGQLIEILAKKIQQEFKIDKDFIFEILTEEVLNLDDSFLEINNYVENYISNIFTIENRIVFEDYKVNKKKAYDMVDTLELEGIFTSELVKCTYFKNESLRKCIINYMHQNDVNYYKIEDILYHIEGHDEISYYKEANFIKIITDLKKLTNLSNVLYKNNIIILKYNFNNFVFTSKGIIINDFKECSNNYDKVTEKVTINNLVTFIIKILNKYVNSEENKVNRLIVKLKNAKIDYFNELELILKESILEVNELSLIDQVENIKKMHDLEKVVILDNIIEKEDYTIESKKIVINYNINKVNNVEAYVNYLIQCFNFYQRDLNKQDLRLIYDKIISLLAKVEDDFIIDNGFNIENMLFQAENITGYNTEKIKTDYLELGILIDEKDYILSRI